MRLRLWSVCLNVSHSVPCKPHWTHIKESTRQRIFNINTCCKFYVFTYTVIMLITHYSAARHSRRRTEVCRVSSPILSSSATQRAQWTELNQKARPHARKWVWFENACPQFVVFPPGKNWGFRNHLFQRLRSLTANLTAYIFGIKHDIDNRVSALKTTRSLLHRLKMSWTLNGPQIA